VPAPDPTTPSRCEDVNSKILEAAKEDDLTALKLLSQCPKADLNTQETPCTGSEGEGQGCGRTPLWWAVFHNNLPMAEFLLEYPGLRFDGKKWGKAEKWYKESQVSPLFLTCSDGVNPSAKYDTDMLKLMLKYPAFQLQLNTAGGPDSYTPLMGAALAGAGFENIVLVLLADPNTNVNTITNKWNPNALYVAAHNGRFRIVDILLRCSKTDINHKNLYNKTALIAARSGMEDAQEDCDKSVSCTGNLNTRLRNYVKTIELIEARAAGETLLGGSTC